MAAVIDLVHLSTKHRVVAGTGEELRGPLQRNGGGLCRRRATNRAMTASMLTCFDDVADIPVGHSDWTSQSALLEQ